ncbi:fatty acid-binding protein, liver isoform X3 [Magallana gigas]|uniref:fatty acid-binding protein, liver isoform X3 n=1 Tax=Magallana gigas TaxID=29159 RepID=UPI00333F5B67
MANFVGRWEDTGERENFDEFATAMNLPADMLEKYRATKQTIQYGINGNTWTMNPSSTLFPGKEKVYTFEIGKEVNDTGLDGNPIKFVITVVSDNEISEDLKVKMGDPWKDYKVSRKVDGDTMTTTLSAFGKTMISKQRRLK